MGSYDGAETCELVVCYMLSLLQPKFGNSVGLYRDDGLGISTGTPKETEEMKKEICKIFKENELRVSIEANRKIVDFLDVTLNLSTGQYIPYMKPNNTLRYVHVKSNHPPSILKNIPIGVNKRLSEISSTEEIFNKAAPAYQKALNDSGYEYELKYEKSNQRKVRRHRNRNVIWYNPPYEQSVKTNIGRKFLKIVDECFPAHNNLHKIFNRNTLKLSYSCMPNMKCAIEASNKALLRKNAPNPEPMKKCNCAKYAECPLRGECLAKDIAPDLYVNGHIFFPCRFNNHEICFCHIYR